jgi:uncharacterized protein (TIGR00369 family)
MGPDAVLPLQTGTIINCRHWRINLPEPNPEHLKAVIIAINNAPFFKHLSMRVTEIGVGYSVVTLNVGNEHMNPFGGLHGGVYASAIDTAAYWSAYCELPEENGLITIDIKVDFLAPVSDKDIIINGRRIKSGKTIYLTEAKMSDANGTLLAHGTSKLMTTRKQSVVDLVNYVGSGKLPPKFLRS